MMIALAWIKVPMTMFMIWRISVATATELSSHSGPLITKWTIVFRYQWTSTIILFWQNSNHCNESKLWEDVFVTFVDTKGANSSTQLSNMPGANLLVSIGLAWPHTSKWFHQIWDIYMHLCTRCISNELNNTASIKLRFIGPIQRFIGKYTWKVNTDLVRLTLGICYPSVCLDVFQSLSFVFL